MTETVSHHRSREATVPRVPIFATNHWQSTSIEEAKCSTVMNDIVCAAPLWAVAYGQDLIDWARPLLTHQLKIADMGSRASENRLAPYSFQRHKRTTPTAQETSDSSPESLAGSMGYLRISPPATSIARRIRLTLAVGRPFLLPTAMAKHSTAGSTFPTTESQQQTSTASIPVASAVLPQKQHHMPSNPIGPRVSTEPPNHSPTESIAPTAASEQQDIVLGDAEDLGLEFVADDNSINFMIFGHNVILPVIELTQSEAGGFLLKLVKITEGHQVKRYSNE